MQDLSPEVKELLQVIDALFKEKTAAAEAGMPTEDIDFRLHAYADALRIVEGISLKERVLQ